MDYDKLKNYLDVVGHPVTGAFDANSETAAAQFNALNRPAPKSPVEMFLYLLNKKHDTVQESQVTPILGRLLHVAESNVGDDPFGRGAGNELEGKHIHAAKTFVMLFNNPLLSELDLSDANLPFGFAQTAGVWSSVHIADMQALSVNKRSFADEIAGEIEYSGPITKYHVSYARAQ